MILKRTAAAVTLVVGATIATAGQSNDPMQARLKQLFPSATAFSPKGGEPPHFKAFAGPKSQDVVGYAFLTTEVSPLERAMTTNDAAVIVPIADALPPTGPVGRQVAELLFTSRLPRLRAEGLWRILKLNDSGVEVMAPDTARELEHELRDLDEQLDAHHDEEDRLSDAVEGGAELDEQGQRDLARLGGVRDLLAQEYGHRLEAVLHYSGRLKAVRSELTRRLQAVRGTSGE